MSAPTSPDSPAAAAFIPASGRVECNAFSGPFKAIAVLVVSLAAIWAWRLWRDGVLTWSLQSSGWLVAALVLMGTTEWYILRGRTTLDALTLEQTWVWHKRVAVCDLAYAKVIRVRGLDWLIAPRLYTKTHANKLAVFYAARGDMLEEFHRLEQHVAAQRLSAMR